MDRTSLKIEDTNPQISSGGRLDRYWQEHGFDDLYLKVRPGLNMATLFGNMEVIQDVQKIYHIRGLEFGRWLSNEDRHNYLNALNIALSDLQRVLKFKNASIGKGILNIAFGARGSGGALAHYEPKSYFINITRYDRNPEIEKDQLFLQTGGMGSLAHEYGHFLDNIMAIKSGLKNKTLTNGSSISTKPGNGKNLISTVVDQILNMIIWGHPSNTKEYTAYYKKLREDVEKGQTKYIIYREELFCRAFETWISYKLEKLKIRNLLLAEPKYLGFAYLSKSEIIELDPYFDTFIDECRYYD
jgi:hypothetical protein